MGIFSSGSVRGASAASGGRAAAVPLYVVVLFAICLITLGGTAVSNYRNLHKLKLNNDWMEHSWSVKDHLKNINVLVVDAENSLLGYFLSGDRALLGPWTLARRNLDGEFKMLEALVQGDDGQKKNLAQLRKLFDRRISKLEEHQAQFEHGGLREVVSAIRKREGNEIMDEVRLLDVIMEKEELEALVARRNRFYHEYVQAVWIGNSINGVAILILIIFFRLIHRNFARQRTVEEALKRANDNLENTVSARTEQLSVLSRHLLKVSEEEKAKLARELHDEMGSALTAVGMDISMVIEKLRKSDPTLAGQLMRAKQTLLESVDLKRRIVEDLRPSMLDNLGLATSIRNHCEKIARIAGLGCTVDISEEFKDLDPEWSIAIFRIVQESLNNAIKYARATHVKISLKRRPNGIWLQVADNGIGTPKDVLEEPKSHGLLGMRERALLLGGSFAVGSGAAGRGTAVEVFLPCAPQLQDAAA